MPNSRNVLFGRALYTGLGDRLTVYLTVAALGICADATVHALWYYGPKSDEARVYRLSSVLPSLTLPRNLRLYDHAGFAAVAANGYESVAVTDPDHEDLPQGYERRGGPLPSCCAFDGVYTTAHRYTDFCKSLLWELLSSQTDYAD